MNRFRWSGHKNAIRHKIHKRGMEFEIKEIASQDSDEWIRNEKKWQTEEAVCHRFGNIHIYSYVKV
jgi:hypothetical protein